MTVFKNMVTSIKTWKAPSTKLSDKSITDQAPVIKRVDKHRRTGRGGEGGCSPPKFWATQIFWAARENLGKASF